ncbi:MAG: Hsp20/alpha crystallin family protein [Desulfatitalea sp.]|nr:Hsp20/alpha crystallin family protein [Desulfatitalea sp.]MBI5896141.1 Hsp20/alpha crystallin family protein [Desulfobacterales bacterium]
MGSIKLDLRNEPKSFQKALEKYFSTAFGPSPALYRHVSLCGWRPLIDPRKLRESDPLPNGQFLPGIEVYETDDGMTIEVALSRIKEESLHLAVSGQRLIIRGERIAEGSQETATSVAARINPLFQHLIPLPETVNAGGFRAQMKGDIVRIDFTRRR